MPARPAVPPLHDAPRAARILEARTRALAARGGTPAGAAAQLALLACAQGNELYGLPLSAVLRVVPFGPCTPAPGTPPAMLGLYGRAGQVFIVLDLGAALGGPVPLAGAGGHLLLLRHAPRRFALRVDRALGAIQAAPADAAGASLAAHRAVIGHALAPAGLAQAGPAPAGPSGDGTALVGLIDLDHLLRPYLADAAPLTPAAAPTGA
ncbi:MAG: hypothetical protein JWP20_1151 [Roseomonas sp.]|jgi:purine-binding chemotaxis protein CheW|nr:hypothetical protein [Roseomonas sp.]